MNVMITKYFSGKFILLLLLNIISSSLILASTNDSTSTAYIKGMDKYLKFKLENPYKGVGNYYAGTFDGRVNDQIANFYCIDMAHNLVYNETYTDAGETSKYVTYILNNYYPFKNFPYPGASANVEREAASVQVAIWHFQDSLDVDKVENFHVKNRAKEIISATKLNSDDTKTIKSLVITPLKNKFNNSEKASFVIEAYDQYNHPAADIKINLFTSTGNELSTYELYTDSTGITDTIFVTSHIADEMVITAHAFVVIPHGTRYVHKLEPEKYQKLVLATPRVDLKEVKGTISWYRDVDLSITKTVNKNECKDGDEVSYNILVKNLSYNPATNIKITEQLSAGLELNSAIGTKGIYQNGFWEIDLLNGNETAELTINATIKTKELLTSFRSLGIASGYNLFVLEDLNQPSSDTEGKAAVGRDACLANYSVGDKLSDSNGNEDVLIVGRKLTFKSGAVLNGNVVYGKFIDVPEYQFGVVNGAIRQDSVIDFKAAKNELISLSNTLNSYDVNGKTEIMWGGIYLTGNDPMFNVFEVVCDDLSLANDFQIDVPNGSVVLVNFIGDSANWGGGLSVFGTDISNVLYNFSTTSKLTIKGINVTGSILAPLADVDFISGVQNGQMIAKSVTGTGQFNNVKFLGNIPDPSIVNVAGITELDQIDSNIENDFSSASIKISFIKDSDDETFVEWEEAESFIAGEMIWTISSGNVATFAGTWGGKIYKSTDNGSSWNNSSEGINAAFIWSIIQNDNYILAGTEKGIFVSSNGGTNWESAGLDSLDTRALAFYNGYFYAGTWGYGLYKTSSDSLENWRKVDLGVANPAIHSLAVEETTNALIAATFGSGLFYTNDGFSFSGIDIGYAHIWSLASTSTGEVYAGTYGAGIFKSSDAGLTWNKVSGLSAKYIYSIAVDNNDNVFASSWNKGVFIKLSDKEGFTSTGLASENVSSISVDATSGQIILGTSDGKIYKGTVNVTDIGSVTTSPLVFELSQNYPNPFNPSTTINYQLSVNSEVSLIVYDILGREIKTLVNKFQSAGKYEVNFDASQLSSGIYFYRITTDSFTAVKRMMLIK